MSNRKLKRKDHTVKMTRRNNKEKETNAPTLELSLQSKWDGSATGKTLETLYSKEMKQLIFSLSNANELIRKSKKANP